MGTAADTDLRVPGVRNSKAQFTFAFEIKSVEFVAMAVEGGNAIMIGDRLALQHPADAGLSRAEAKRSKSMRIPIALSSAEIDDLSAALASYMARQSLGATPG